MRINVEMFNELVWDFGANGTNSESVEKLSGTQLEVVAMAWHRSNQNDEEINSFYPEFLKA